MHCSLKPQGQHFIGYLPVQCCLRSIKTTLNRVFPAQYCLEPLRQHCTKLLPKQCCPKSIKTTVQGYFVVQCCLETLGQHCTEVFPVHFCLENITATFYKIFFMCNVDWSLLNNIALGSYMRNVVPRILRQH